MTNIPLTKHYQDFKDAFDAFIRQNPRQPGDEKCELLAVSKKKPADDILALYQLGQRYFGENYLLELEAKALELKESCPEIKFSYIGALQSNKIQKIVKYSWEIQTVTSEKHLSYIARYAEQFNKTPFPVYISINLDNEPQKNGVTFGQAELLKKAILEKFGSSLQLEGLMTIPSVSTSTDAKNYPEISNEIPVGYTEFCRKAKKFGRGRASIGMSGDWKASVAAGSHCIRIGTTIFGKRD